MSGPRWRWLAIMAASCSGFQPRPTIPERPHISAAILSVARDPSLFGLRLKEGCDLSGDEALGLLGGFDGAATDMRRDEQIAVIARILHERVSAHARRIFRRENVHCGAS